MLFTLGVFLFSSSVGEKFVPGVVNGYPVSVSTLPCSVTLFLNYVALWYVTSLLISRLMWFPRTLSNKEEKFLTIQIA